MSILKWTGLNSTKFTDKLNWKPEVAPTTTSDCEINPTVATKITATGKVTINSLETDAKTALTLLPTFDDQATTFAILGKPDSANPTGASTNAGTISVGTSDAGGETLLIDRLFTNTGKVTVTGMASQADLPINNIQADGTFTNEGKVVENDAPFTLGNATHGATAINEAGATWSLLRDASIGEGKAGGSTFINDGTLTAKYVKSSDSWGITTAKVSVATTNDGVVDLVSGNLTFDKAVTGTGTMNITLGTLDLVTGKDAGQTVDFLGTAKGTQLDLGAPGAFAGHIGGFAGLDVIELLKTTATSESFAGGVLTVKDGTSTVAQLHFDGAYSTSSFSLSTKSGNTLIHFV